MEDVSYLISYPAISEFDHIVLIQNLISFGRGRFHCNLPKVKIALAVDFNITTAIGLKKRSQLTHI